MLRLGLYGPKCQRIISCQTIVEARAAYREYAHQPQTVMAAPTTGKVAHTTTFFEGYDLKDTMTNSIIASGEIA